MGLVRVVVMVVVVNGGVSFDCGDGGYGRYCGGIDSDRGGVGGGVVTEAGVIEVGGRVRGQENDQEATS